MKNKFSTIVLILFTANGCSLMYQIPKAGGKTGNYTNKTLLLIAHLHYSLKDKYPITYQIILEPRSPSGNESCWIRGSCKNIKHSFNYLVLAEVPVLNSNSTFPSETSPVISASSVDVYRTPTKTTSESTP